MSIQRAARTPYMSSFRAPSTEPRVPFLDVFQPLHKQPDDVLVIEGVVHVAARAPRTDEAPAAGQTQLMGNGGFADADAFGELMHAELVRARQRIKDAHARRVAEHLE